MRFLGLTAALICVLIVVEPARGQTLPPETSDDQMGIQAYQSYHGGDIDVVSLTTGTLNLNLSFLSYPQRGKLHFSFNLLYNNQQQHQAEFCPPHGACEWIWGYTPFPPSATLPLERSDVFVAPAQAMLVWGTNMTQQYVHFTVSWANWSLQTADGSRHPLGNLGTFTLLGQEPTEYYQYSGPWETLDATGKRVNGTFVAGTTSGINKPTPTAIVDPDGVAYATANAFEEDPNGNMITLNGGTFTDSLGRQITSPPTASSSSNTGTSGCPQPPQVLLPVDHAVLWSVPGPNGNSVNYTFCYAIVAINIPPNGTQYPGLTGTSTKLQSIVLPNGQAWNYQYNDPGDGSTYNGSPINYGTLTQVGLPVGGTISYSYVYEGGVVGCQNSGRWVASRTVNANDGTGPHKWTYNYTLSGNGSASSTTVTDPLGNYTIHTFGLGTCSVYETQTQYYQNGGTLLKTVATTYNYLVSGNLPNSGLINVVPIKIVTTWPNGKMSQVTKAYDSGFSYLDYLGRSTNVNGAANVGIYGKVISESDYDYTQSLPGTLLRTTNTTYQAFQNSNYLTNNLLDLPYSVQVQDGGGTQRAYTYFLYDEGGTRAPSGISTQRDTSPPDSPYWGNQTSAHHWLNTTSNYLTSTATYFDTGTVDVSTDPKGNPTTFAYSATYAGAYPTTVTNALSQPTNHTYDFNTGLLASTTDPNNQTTSFTYDSMWRLASVTYPDGGSATITRQESTFPFSATLTQKITSSQNKVTTNIFDGVGRVSQSQLTNPDTSCPTIKIDLTYDALGRKSTASNPHCDSARTTDGTTTYGYDALSRVTLITQPDSSTVQMAYCAGTTLVTDEASHWRRSTTDGLGRLIEVDEPNSLTATVNSNGCPGTGEPIWVTSYTYDALDDLATVVQNSSRNRNFSYDSLKRLTSAANPESGTSSYTYDADGNVVTKTVPAQDQTGSATVTLSYCYEALNRMTSKAYTNQSCPMTSPVATYTYDQTACGFAHCSNIGHRTSMTDAAGSETWNYDVPDRMSNDKRITNGVPNTVSYLYNYDHSIATLTYPTSRVITYTTDSAGRPSDAQDVANGINYATGTCNNGNAVLSTGTCYAPQGALGLIQNGANLVTTFLYNDRLQPCWTYATSGTPPTPLPWNTTSTNCTSTFATGSVLDLKYNFSLGTDNGNVTGITNDRVPNRSQNFTYDQLNRIAMAETTSTHATDPTNCWGEAYVYDLVGGPAAWGNLIQINPASSAYFGCTQESLNQSLGTLTNNQISGWCYDASGNLLAETTCPTGPPYAYMYDAENHLTSTAGVTYAYDGDGKRVQKSSGMLYWYGMGADPLDETNSAGTMTDEYIFFGGKRIARRDPANNVVYYFADHLGTSRVVANAAGTISDDSDFYPFGGERVVLSGSGNTYKFTGKERDSESGLDNFGARYNSSSIGRFMSVDPSRVSVKLYDPQTWNRYAYARDNPLRYVDPNGKWSTSVHNEIIDDVFRGVLSDPDREILKQASAWVDRDQSVSGAFKHGMRGLDQRQNDARQLGEAFVAGNLDDAVRKQLDWEAQGHTGWNPGALFSFGEALHTVTDAASPWHGNYSEVWGGYWDPIGSGGHALAELVLGNTRFLDADRSEAEYQGRVLWTEFQKKLQDERAKEEEDKRRKACAEGDKKACGIQ